MCINAQELIFFFYDLPAQVSLFKTESSHFLMIALIY